MRSQVEPEFFTSQIQRSEKWLFTMRENIFSLLRFLNFNFYRQPKTEPLVIISNLFFG